MRKKAIIINIKKREVSVKKKKDNYKNYSFYFSIIVMILCVSILGVGYKFLSNEISMVFNPVNSLYSDNSDIVFTSGEISKLEFYLPMIGAKVENNNGVIELTVGKSIMVMSPESGEIADCGVTLNGVKYIKIKHNKNIYSVIENVDILGVVKGDIVKRGQDIASAKVGERVVLKIYENDLLVTNLKINQSKIICQN